MHQTPCNWLASAAMPVPARLPCQSLAITCNVLYRLGNKKKKHKTEQYRDALKDRGIQKEALGGGERRSGKSLRGQEKVSGAEGREGLLAEAEIPGEMKGKLPSV